jgi:hypothetical protein
MRDAAQSLPMLERTQKVLRSLAAFEEEFERSLKEVRQKKKKKKKKKKG